ncbi:hypothetical protein D3C81_1227420 [compost metagenome]
MVFKCTVSKIIYTRFEVFCIESKLLEGLRNSKLFVHIADRFDQALHAFFSCACRQSENTCDFSITLVSYEASIFRPCSKFSRFLSIVTNNVRHQDSVCASMSCVVLTAPFMRQAVVDAEECIRKCHTCKRRCIMHFFASQFITSQRRLLKVLEYQLNRFDCKTICKVICHYRYISFNSMCKNVHTCICYSNFRQAIYKFRIDDSNIRCQFIVCQRIFSITIFFICNNCERSYFRTCTRSCRNRNKFRFLTKTWIFINTFTDIHEFLFQVMEICIRIFIE